MAVLFAVCCLMLFGMAAVAVDLGNAYEVKTEVQAQVDLAALAGGAALPDVDAVKKAVCDQLLNNVKRGQGFDCPGSVMAGTTTVSDPLCPPETDTGSKPFLWFFSNNKYKVKVCAPRATVPFEFARAISNLNEVKVTATATVAAGTPGASAEMPYYANGASGCDWGAQSLTDPANGQSTGIIPSNLDGPTTWLGSSPAGTSPTGYVNNSLNINLASVSPTQLDLGASSASFTIQGGNGTGPLSSVTAVGFFRTLDSTGPTQALRSGITSDSTGKTVTVAINNAVGSTDTLAPVLRNEGVWYIRVYKTATGNGNTGWSSTALPIRVGEPLISCGNASNSGNFGAVKLPRTDSSDSTSNGWMPNNIANGLQSPLSLAVMPGAASPWTCTDGGANVVYSTVTGSPVLKAGTNCLATDTGLTATATTAGLVTGTSLFSGRLTRRGTSTGVLGRDCGPNRASSSRSLLGKTVNNDTLTCFMTNPATPISTIASSGYTGGAALDPAIYKSPRFCYVPVVKYDPTKGRSFNYQVTDMRPCFITSESMASTWNNQAFTGGTGTNNGLTLNTAGNRITTLGVVFFHRNALPSFGDSIGDYIGVGSKSVAMVQ